jgi:hypothetical protein
MRSNSSASTRRTTALTNGNELEKTLKNQDSTYVEFDNDDEGCVWNVKVIWANYDEAVLWKNVNLCKFTALRLRYDSGTRTTSFLAE